MRIAFFSPLPPLKSGIAGYSAMILPGLAKRFDVTVVVDQPEWNKLDLDVIRVEQFDPSGFDSFVFQLGNNPYHEFAYREALRTAGVVVLHDAVLHHLIVEMTLARGEADEYVETLRKNHGEAGAALARARVGGIHDEIANFLYPASIEIAQRSRSVIVHNDFARRMLVESGVTNRIDVVEHPVVEWPGGDRGRLRSELGYAGSDLVVGMFGFVTSAKRPEVVFESFTRAFSRNGALKLLVVGEEAPNVNLRELASRFALPDAAWRTTGYVSDRQFDDYLAAVDRVVNLRYPSAGETSGALIHAIAAGKEVAVSDYGPFADYPAEIVTRIPFDREIDALVSFMLSATSAPQAAESRKAWIRSRCDLAIAIDCYARVLEEPAAAPRVLSATSPQLFPELELMAVEQRSSHGARLLEMTLRNRGGALPASRFGEPSCRIIAKLFDGEREVADRWLSIDRNLPAGDAVVLTATFPSVQATELRLSTTIEGPESIDFAPFATWELAR